MEYRKGTRLMIYAGGGLTGFWYFIYPDYEDFTFLERSLKAGELVYDVGANAGGYAVFMLSCGCSVVAFEPVPKTFKRLKENVVLNAQIGSIVPLNVAVGSSAGMVSMTQDDDTGNKITEGPAARTIQVECRTLDSVVAEQGIPAFVKIDVEGHELNVVRGMRETLKDPKLRGLLIETFRSFNWKMPQLQELESILLTNGFQPCEYHVATTRVTLLSRPELGENNTLYLRDPEGVNRRLEEFAANTVRT